MKSAKKPGFFQKPGFSCAVAGDVDSIMKYVALSDVCQVIAGQSPPSKFYNREAVGLPFFQGKADFGDLYPSVRIWCSKPQKVAQAGDILISVRAPVGPTNLANQRCCIGRGLSAIRPLGKMERRFLLHYLRYIEPLLSGQGRGSTFSAITQKELRDLKIPLPALSEQKRIAAILDKADALRAKRRAALAKLDILLQATFLDMFGDPVTNPMGWPTKRLDQFGEITTGSTPSRKRREYYGSFIEWIKSDNINTPYHTLTHAQESLSKLGSQVGRTVRANSILVTCIAGSPECIGNAAIADREVAFNQQINAITPFEKGVSFFLYTQFLVGKNLVQNASTNSMKGMVSKSAFSSVRFISPPLEKQRTFSQLAEKIQREINRQIWASGKFEALFHSLQQRAFKGEL